MVKTKIKTDKSKNKKTTKQKQKQSQKVIINFFKDIVRKKKAKKRKGKAGGKVPPPKGLTTSSNYQYKDPIPRVPQQIPPPPPQIPQAPINPNPVGGIPRIPAPILQPADIQQAVRNALREERINQGVRIRQPPVRQPPRPRFDLPEFGISESDSVSDSVSSVIPSGRRQPPKQPVAKPRSNIDEREKAQRDNAEFVGVGGHQVPQEPINLINPEQQQQFQKNIQRTMLRREAVQNQRNQNMESDSDTDNSLSRRQRDRLQRRQTKELRDIGGRSGRAGQAQVQRDVALGNMEAGQLRRVANEQLVQRQNRTESNVVASGDREELMNQVLQMPYNNAERILGGRGMSLANGLQGVAENTDIDSQNPSNLSQAYAPSEVQRRTQTGVEDRNQVRNSQALTKAKTHRDDFSSTASESTDEETRHLERIAMQNAQKADYIAQLYESSSVSDSSVSPDNVSKEEGQRIAMRNLIRKTLKKGRGNLTDGDLQKIAIIQSHLQELGGSGSEYEIPESDIEVNLTHIKDPVLHAIQQGVSGIAGGGKAKKTSKAVARERLRNMGEIISENPARPTKQTNVQELQAIANDMGSSGDEILDYSKIIQLGSGYMGKNQHLDRLRYLHTNLKKDDGEVSPDEFVNIRPKGVAKGTRRGQYRQNVGMGGEILDPRVREAPKQSDTLNRPDEVDTPAPDDLQGQGLPDEQPPQQPSESDRPQTLEDIAFAD